MRLDAFCCRGGGPYIFYLLDRRGFGSLVLRGRRFGSLVLQGREDNGLVTFSVAVLVRSMASLHEDVSIAGLQGGNWAGHPRLYIRPRVCR